MSLQKLPQLEVPSLMPDFATMFDALRWQAANDPTRLAAIYLEDGEAETERLTYGELDRRIRAIAAGLQRRVEPGDRVLLLYPTGPDFIAAFFACFYVGAIAVAAPPPLSQRALPRIDVIVRDCQPNLAIAGTATVEMFSRPGAPEALRRLPVVSLKQILGDPAKWTEIAAKPSDPVFLQYTSGSTSVPKGVIVTNRNLVVNMRMLQAGFMQTGETPTLSWLPVFHDMGLITGLTQPLFIGTHCILMPSIRFIQKPIRWLRAISKYSAYTSGGPNFAFDLCVRKTTAAEREGLDLSGWQVAFNGAEPIKAETLARFAETFAPYGFRAETHYPCYGLAEGTLIISGGRRTELPVVRRFHSGILEQGEARPIGQLEQPGTTLVSSGRTLLRQSIKIVEPQTRAELPDQQVGEIWVKGENIAEGFWRQQEKTETDLRAKTRAGDGPYLRTGDLGFLDHGELFVTGRAKDLIIVNGRNIYPQDIEHAATQCHEVLTGGTAAAFEIGTGEDHKVVLVHEVSRHYRKFDLKKISDLIRQTIWALNEVFLNDLVLVKPAGLHKTTSGKIMRQATRQQYLDGALSAVWSDESIDGPAAEATTDPEHQESGDKFLSYLLEKIAKAADCEVSSIDPSRSILAVGLNSLKASSLAQEVEAEQGWTLPTTFFLQEISLEEIAAELAKLPRLADKTPATRNSVGQKSYPTIPLSRGQRALWFQHLLEPTSPAYNVVLALRLFGELDIGALQQALSALMRRYPSLACRLRMTGAQPTFRFDDSKLLPLEIFDLSMGEQSVGGAEDPLAALTKMARRPFELSAGQSLVRAGLFKVSAEEHTLLFCCHHIICDGWSIDLILEALYQCWRGEDVETSSNASDYLAYICAQEAELSGPAGTSDLDYWRDTVAANRDDLDLPIYHPRKTERTLQGRSIPFALSRKQRGALSRFSRRVGATQFAILLAVYQVLLGRHHDYEEFNIGTITAARLRASFNDIVGYFANPIVIRSFIQDAPSFETLVRRVQSETIQGLSHQNLPLQVLVEQQHPRRSASHQPLFQVGFGLTHLNRPVAESFAAAHANWPMAEEIAGLKIVPFILPQQEGQFDINLEFIESDAGFYGSLNFSTVVLSSARAEILQQQFLLLLDDALKAPETAISNLSFLPAATMRQRAEDNRLSRSKTAKAWADADTVHQLIAGQAADRPQSTALICAGATLDYGELDRRSDRLARQLIAMGAGRGHYVILLLRRSFEMVIAMLAVMKSSAAYIPVDEEHQRPWIPGIISDSQAMAIITEADAIGNPRSPLPPVVTFAGEGDWPKAGAAVDWRPKVSGNDLACVIYTSGSTGAPKGVMIPHRSICLRLKWKCETFKITAEDVFLQVISYSFDPSIWEIFTPLICGGKLVIPTPAGQKDPAHLAGLLKQHQIGFFSCVPSLLRFLVQQSDFAAAKSLRHVICGGESLSLDICQQFHAVTGAQLEHFYGPTEATIFCSHHTIGAADPGPRMPIGKPVGHAQIHILDRYLQPVADDTPGQLYIGGEGLAHGYLNAPALTREKFIPDPFGGPGDRLYATGDIASYRNDGVIQFIGRADAQVKLRGYRVELGEIERHILDYPNISQVLVTTHQDAGGDSQLVAYIVQGDGAQLDSAGVRQYLSQRLPVYMVPDSFVTLDTFPLTSNGKIDHARLPMPQAQEVMPESPPDDALEASVTELWERLLHVSAIARGDNFFDLGGHSILALRLQAQLESNFDVKLSVTTLFQNPTIRELARVIRDQAKKLPSSPIFPIQRQGDKTPIYCVAAGHGDIMRFSKLAPQLDPDRPFFALVPNIEQIDGEAAPDIEDLAQFYTNAIRQRHHEGPYFIAGFSVGGVIAIEVARQLQRQHQVVFPPILLDTVYPTWTTGSAGFFRIARFLFDRNLFGFAGFGRWLRAIFTDQGLHIHMNALRHHTVKDYPGQLVLFRTKGNAWLNFQFFSKWRKVAQKGLITIHIPGWHGSMFRNPHVKEFGKVLRGHLEQTEQENGVR